MRHGTSNRRSRGRSNNNNNRGKGGAPNRSQVFDSNGPEVRIRGTAHQILEKYEALAKDARGSGDLVLAESYLQHAEHYQRIIMVWDEQAAQQNAQRMNDDDEAYTPRTSSANQDDDLSLPASILGGEVKSNSQPARQLEDA